MRFPPTPDEAQMQRLTARRGGGSNLVGYEDILGLHTCLLDERNYVVRPKTTPGRHSNNGKADVAKANVVKGMIRHLRAGAV